MPPERTQIAIAIIERRGDYLVGRRPAGVALAGLWEFPGGKVEAGETPRETAAREALEETGIAVEVCDEYSSLDYDYAHDRVLLHFFACLPREPAPQPRLPFEWMPGAKLADLPFPPANAEIVKRLAASG